MFLSQHQSDAIIRENGWPGSSPKPQYPEFLLGFHSESLIEWIISLVVILNSSHHPHCGDWADDHMAESPSTLMTWLFFLVWPAPTLRQLANINYPVTHQKSLYSHKLSSVVQVVHLNYKSTPIIRKIPRI